MPEAVITFDDGTVARLHVTSFSTENDVSHIEAMDGSRARIRRGRQGVTMSIEGVIVATAYREDFATSELVTAPHVIESDELLWRRLDAAIGQGLMSVEMGRATGSDLDAFAAQYGLARFSTGSTPAKPKPAKKPPAKPRPKSAWDRLLGPDLLEETA